MLQEYLKAFSSLRTDRGRHRYPAVTNYRAPHKPFLLLSIMDLISQGLIDKNFIEPSFDLVDTWNIYYATIMPPGSTTSMAYPFSRLKSDGFWRRIPRPGYDAETEYNIKSMNRIRKVYFGAKLDEELFQFLCNPETRELLRLALIQTYFAKPVQSLLLEQGKVNIEAYQYSRQLMEKAGEKGGNWAAPDEPQKNKVRDQGFRKAIVTIYEHRCAICGIRMLTPDGHTVVEAAHVRPWNQSHDDRPTNGMALCRLCHWSFDEGLMSVGKEYEVLVSRRVQVERNLPGHILTLRDRAIFTPMDEGLRPDQENLQWHRRSCFKI